MIFCASLLMDVVILVIILYVLHILIKCLYFSVEALEFESGKIKECLESGPLSSFKSLPGVYQSSRINENENSNEKLLGANIDSDRSRRHRDTSLERHWEEQVMAREAEQFSPHATRRFTPGKLGKVKSWEMRIKSEEEGLPPTRTAQIQKRKRKEITNNKLENIRLFLKIIWK